MSQPANLADHTIVASLSGGKDSVALCLWLREQELPHRRIFMDTGWEAQDTYDHLDYLASELGSVERLSSEGMVSLIQRKAMFPGRMARFCTQELKTKLMKAYMARLQDNHGDVINAIGVRRAESRARSKLSEWEWSDAVDCQVWRPLIAWTEEDVIAIHKRHDIRPNPLYLKGASRVGCWPCIFACKNEIRMVAELDPGRIDVIRELEQHVQERARARYAERGETFESLGYKPPTYFSRDLGEGKAHIPIDDVVTWAKTSRGGRQFELFNREPPGCYRWGLCGV
ncbi:MAG: phosphoadenosine phosphosulfate reductase family protein [Myxococcota bacterium]